MGYAGETVYGWSFEGAVDEEGVVMADKCWNVSERVDWKERRYIPNEITPIAWKTPLLIVKRGVLNVPLDSLGTTSP